MLVAGALEETSMGTGVNSQAEAGGPAGRGGDGYQQGRGRGGRPSGGPKQNADACVRHAKCHLYFSPWARIHCDIFSLYTLSRNLASLSPSIPYINRAPYRASSTPIHTRDDNILLSETKGKDSDPDPQASSTWRTLGASVFLVLESSSFRDGIDITKVDRANCGSTLFATTTRRYLGDVATCQIPHLRVTRVLWEPNPENQRVGNACSACPSDLRLYKPRACRGSSCPPRVGCLRLPGLFRYCTFLSSAAKNSFF
ncbi:hypothetical protein GBA52_028864 [Prunus armeniaca]|nr:hypothetical protein GBA52_028864 [Prunus armeniaca]